MKENTTKFYASSISVTCKLNDDDISISVDSGEGCVRLYRLQDSDWIYYKYCKSKKSSRFYISSRYVERYQTRFVFYYKQCNNNDVFKKQVNDSKT